MADMGVLYKCVNSDRYLRCENFFQRDGYCYCNDSVCVVLEMHEISNNTSEIKIEYKTMYNNKMKWTNENSSLPLKYQCYKEAIR